MANKAAEKRRRLNKINKARRARRNNNKNEDRVRLFVRGKSLDYGLLAVVFILLTVGLIMLLSASAPYALRTEGDSYYYFSKQLMFVGIGVVLMFVISRIDYRILNSRLSWLAYVGGLRIYVFSTSSTE